MNKFCISTKHKATPRIKKQRALHGVLNFAVYLVLCCLTTGVGICADAGLNENENETPPLSLPSMVPLKQNILYMLLVAEMAAHRQNQGLALNNYLIAANMTKDPAVAEQATFLAISMEAPNEATISAELWANKDPKNIQAQLIAMTLLISQSAEKAIPYLIRAIELQPTEADQYILEIQAKLSENSVNNLKKALTRIASERPSDPYAHLIAAQSAAEQKDVKNAKRWVDSALKLKPDLTRAIVLKARLIRYEKNSDAPAIQFLAKQLERFPENSELRFFYANALLDNENTETAKAELSQLVEDKSFGGYALLLLGEIYFKENHWKTASNFLQKALDNPQSKDAAQYLLGEIEEKQGDKAAAIEYYSNIASGPYHVLGILHAVTLLKKNRSYKDAIELLHNSNPSTNNEQKQLLIAEIDLLNASKASEEAMQLINEILPKIPDDADLLYMRAITATKLKKWDIAENDLKKILDKNPNNAKALNALGHTLSFNHKRLPEAIRYLTEALNIAPNNPEFMDSMGWAYYRLGDLKQAIIYSKKANDLSQDGKIAAHFGEILWMSNQKKEAMLVWRKALDQDNEHEELLETLKRFKVVDVEQRK